MLQLVRDLGVTGIMAGALFLIARLFEPLVRELIEARKAATRAREEATELTQRVVVRFEASDKTVAAATVAQNEAIKALQQLTSRLEEGERKMHASVTDTRMRLDELPVQIEKRLAAPDSATMQAHIARTNAAVEAVQGAMNNGLKRIETLLIEVKSDMASHRTSDSELVTKLDTVLTLLREVHARQQPTPAMEPPADTEPDKPKDEP